MKIKESYPSVLDSAEGKQCQRERNQRRFENVPVSKTKSQRCELSRKENDFVSQGNRAHRQVLLQGTKRKITLDYGTVFNEIHPNTFSKMVADYVWYVPVELFKHHKPSSVVFPDETSHPSDHDFTLAKEKHSGSLYEEPCEDYL
ncbi:unnamed protein product [Brugia pahangi]|uniref:Transposase n=1 Tax=Brugia pahangi TaxID=6280 RepID=A0A0N4T758_BRUPA|nr:unnamed protein product [Brugia pahangi]